MSKERLILVGGGGFCRELYFWASECHAAGRLPPVGGYLDDAGDTLMGFDYPVMPWIGGVEAHEPGSGDRYVLAVGHPRAKRALHGLLATRGAIFPRLIHPSARVLRTAALGEGVIFCPGAAAGPDTKINRFVTFNAVCGAGHDAQVGEFTTISSAVDITGGVQIGKDVMIGSGVTFLPRIKVGDGATIGAGCTVYRSVPAGATAYTQPAKILRAIRKDPS